MTQTACSRALQINEIVRMICEEADTGTWRSHFKTLVSLARTSKIFNDPALDVIWHEQQSLMPLVKCMPESLWEERGVKGVGAGVVIHLRRPITSTDIPRLLFYSVRVRTLKMDYSTYGTIDSEFLRALDLSLPTQGFMPRLCHFSWSPNKKGPLSFMHHLLGPQIREIDLDLGNCTGGLSILPSIKSLCPLISDFTFDVKVDPLSVRLISDAVCGWQYLTDLSIPNLDKAGFIHVAGLTSLTSLSLCYAKDTAFLHPPEFLSGTTFPVLKYLFIRCETSRFCAGVLQVISSRTFENLTIRPMVCWTTSAWQKLHTTLRDCLNHATFNSIDVEETGEDNRPADTESYVLSADALRPLLAFTNMNSVMYQVYPCLDVDDDFLEEMALAWPQIGTLQFGTEVSISQRPRATLKCLITFAGHCSQLSTLGIRMDASQVPEFKQVPRNRLGHKWLDRLDVGTSTISSSKEALVAAFISNLFPELEYLFSFDATPLPEPLNLYSSSWNRVSEMVPVFCSVRSQEEEFWTEEIDESEDEETGETGTLDEVEEIS
ncbi:hypothetical protein B0H19DRAFT_1267532 [Mycena capillaripes]|nr:hypothetical protein B0H19DRAFT_1267532 [Mycena capillaripes]